MFSISVRPYLIDRAPFHFRTQYVHLFGVGESDAEMRIIDLIDAQDNPTIAPYASEGECMFRVTQRIGSDSDPDLVTPVIEEMKKRFGSHIYEIGSRSMKEIVFSLLQQNRKTVSFAESCTGGNAFFGVLGYTRRLRRCLWVLSYRMITRLNEATWRHERSTRKIW